MQVGFNMFSIPFVSVTYSNTTCSMDTVIANAMLHSMHRLLWVEQYKRSNAYGDVGRAAY